jgi:hypothetical protein
MEKARDAIQKQIALGGLRLAYVIQHIFGSSEVVDGKNETFLQ